MTELIFATHNSNKAVEVQAALQAGIRVITLKEAAYEQEIPETGKTLAENALIKARTIYKALGKDCFADDTGLEVEVLNGEPGIYSARYAGADNNSEKNIDRLLENLQNRTNRKACFRTVFALIMNGQEYLFKGIAEGEIITQRRGESGFGYDPVFVPNGHLKSFAEMSLGEKNKISHRAKALGKMAEFINREIKNEI